MVHRKPISFDLAIGTGLGLFAMWIAGKFAGIEIDDHHDGLMFKVAHDIYNGAVPFRDTFTQYGLLLSLMQSWAMWLVEPTVLSIRLLTVVCYGAAAALLYIVWRRFVGWSVAALTVLAWLMLAPFYLYEFLPWSSSTVLPFQTAMILYTLRYLEEPSRANLRVIGIMVGLIFWIRMPVAVLSLITLVGLLGYIGLAKARSKSGLMPAIAEIKQVLIGVLVVSVPFLLYLLFRGALRDWFLQTFMMAFYFARTIPQVWSGSQGFLPSVLSSLFPFNVGFIWVLLPVSVLACLGWSVNKTMREAAAARDIEVLRILVLSALCVASWAQYYPVTEDRHVFWGATPMFVLVPVALIAIVDWAGRAAPARWSIIARRAAASVAVIGVLGVLAPPLYARIEVGRQRLASNGEMLSTPAVLKGIKVTQHRKALYESMAGDLAAAERDFPGSPVITIGYDPLYLTFARPQKNWHPLYVFFDIGVAIYPEFPTALSRFIAERRPIIWTAGSVPRGYKVAAHYANGMSLVVPGLEATPPLLNPNTDGTPLDLKLHARVPNRYNLKTPMRVTGQRFPAVGPLPDGTLEFVFRPDPTEGPHATVVTNLFGPDPGRGIRVHRTAGQGQYRVTVGFRQGLPKPIMTFQAEMKTCNHIVVTWKGSDWRLSRNGVEVARVDAPGAIGGSSNQLVVNSGLSRLEYHMGLVDEIRVLGYPLDEAAIRRNARWTAQHCAQLGGAVTRPANGASQ